MTTSLTTNFEIPIPPLDTAGTADGYGTLLQAADTAIFNAIAGQAWTDYSATSTIVGWSVFTTKILKYKKVGTIVFVQFYFSGTSDSTDSTFTLPYATVNATRFGVLYGVDNSTVFTSPGLIIVNGTDVFLYTSLGSDAWTAANGKTAAGEFFYEVA